MDIVAAMRRAFDLGSKMEFDPGVYRPDGDPLTEADRDRIFADFLSEQMSIHRTRDEKEYEPPSKWDGDLRKAFDEGRKTRNLKDPDAEAQFYGWLENFRPLAHQKHDEDLVDIMKRDRDDWRARYLMALQRDVYHHDDVYEAIMDVKGYRRIIDTLVDAMKARSELPKWLRTALEEAGIDFKKVK